MTKEEFLTKTGVKKRGWSDAMIRDLLGEPDKTRHNFTHSGGSPILLYALARVVAAESAPKFVERKAKALTRSQTGTRVAKAKADTNKALFDSIPIHIEKWDTRKVILVSCLRNS